MLKTCTKALLPLLLCAFLLPSSPMRAATYRDVPAGHWAAGAIEEVSALGLMHGVGDGRFAPEHSVTRAEFATMLYNLSPNKRLPSAGVVYSDLHAGSAAWYRTPALWAKGAGLVAEKAFRGEEVIARETMAEWTSRYLDRYHPGALPKDGPAFPDSARPAVRRLAAARLLAGRGALYEPQSTMTRAEAAAMLARLAAFAKAHPAQTLPTPVPAERDA